MGKMNVYDIIQAELIARLQEAVETGIKFHWIKPWSGGADYACSYNSPEKPFNAFVNRLFLEPGEYLTITKVRQLHEENPAIKIKKGAKMYRVYQSFPVFKKDDNGENIKGPDGELVIERFSFRYTKEFHISDIEGLPSHFEIQEYTHTSTEATERADRAVENFCKAMDIDFQINKGSNRAFYSWSISGEKRFDSISLPDKSQFKNQYEYYSTVFHELTHSTKWLTGRKEVSYAYEELVAEVGAATMCFLLHISDEDTKQNSIAYLQVWEERLKSEKAVSIVTACNEAKKACEIIMSYAPELKKEQIQTEDRAKELQAAHEKNKRIAVQKPRRIGR